MRRFLKILVFVAEAVAAFFGVCIVLSLLIVWRLSHKPVSSDFLTPYIEAGIESILPGSEVHADATLLTWSSAAREVTVHADNIVVNNEAGGEIAIIPTFDAKISVLGLMFGQFIPKDLSIDHPQIKLERNKAGVFVFGGMQMGGAEAEPREESLNEALRNISEHLSHAVLMHKLAVTRAVFTVHDDVTQKDWAVSIPEISITRKAIGEIDRKLEYGALDGQMTVEVTQKDTVASVGIHYIYEPDKVRHILSARFEGVTPAFIAGGRPETLGLDAASIVDLPLNGKIEAILDKNLAIETLDVHIHGAEGNLVYADFWDAPCPVKSLDINAAYDSAGRTLKIYDTSADFAGPVLDVVMDGTSSSDPKADLDFTAMIKMQNMPMNRYGSLWPKPILPDPRYWLDANLRDGTFTSAEVKLNGALAWSDLANVDIKDGSGKLSAVNARVTYLDGMPPVEGVSADATFDLKKMQVQITGGGIGAIRLSPFTVVVSGLDKPDQDIDIPLQVSGPLPDVMRLLDHQPLGYAKALGIAPDDIAGSVSGLVKFHLPLLKTVEMKDVSINATAALTGVVSSKLVPGVAIDNGNLALTLDTSGFALQGQAGLDKIPFQVAWQEQFEPKAGKPFQHATVTGPIKDDQWNNLGITIFAGTKGNVNATLDITKPTKNKMTLSGALDFTPAALQFDKLNWKKPANVSALMKFTADAPPGKPVSVTSLLLRGPHLNAVGTASMSQDLTQILSLDLSPMIVGRTDAVLHFTQTFGAHGALSFTATGNALDVSGLRGGNDPEAADPRPKEFHIKVAKLYSGDIGEIDNAEGMASRDGQGWSEISLSGLADGDAPLTIDLIPQADGHRDLKIDCDNFGKAMKGLGFTDTIKDGKITVTGVSTVDSPRVVEGHVQISDFTVVKLPALGLLLNATSPFGFPGLITGSASFSRFSGDFRWQGDTLTFTKAHAAGSAIGINVDGRIDMNTGDANLQGTLVPFSTMNKVLGFIPLIGDLLTGGQDQGVIAAAYTIKGSLAKPDINVNPVSLLAPGFIRNLFFRDDTEDEGQ